MILYWCQGEGTLPRVGQLSGVANCWQRSVQNPNKSARNFFKNNFEKPLDNQHKMCYNDKAVRDRNPLLNKMGGEPTAEYERSLYD